MLQGLGHAIGGRWRQLATSSTNRRIFSATSVVAGLTLAVALATLAREQYIAATFGTGDALDAFLIALLLPQVIINVVAGSFNLALIPTYIHVREWDGEDAAQRVFSGVMAISIALLASIAGLLALTAPWFLPLLGSSFEAEKLRLTQRLFYILLPIIIINGLTTIWGAMLNARERFALVAVAPIVIPLGAILSLLSFGRAWGIHALAFGTVAGFALQSCLLGWALRGQGVSIWPRWHGIEPAMRQVLGQYLPVVAGVALMSSTALVDQGLAATLAPGSVAALSYGNKLVTLVTGISATALGTAVLPYVSRLVAADDWVGVRHTLKTYSKITLLTTIPLTCILYLSSTLIVRLLFERGAFTAVDTQLVARVQAMYVLQVPFYALTILFYRVFSSLRANHLLMWSAIVNAGVNIGLDYLLARIIGVAGIALATTLMYLISFCVTALMLYRALRPASRSA